MAFLNVLLVAGTAVLVFLNRAQVHSLDDAQPTEMVIGITFSVVGALIASRQRRNPIGWLFLGIALVAISVGSTRQYTVRSFTDPSIPAGQWAAWYGNWAIAMIFPSGMALFLFLLFPNGRLPTPRWRVLAWLAAANSAAFAVLGMIDPEPIQVREGLPTVPNPLAVQGAPSLSGPSGNVFLLGIILLAATAVAVGLRLRRSRGKERQQLQLFAYAGVLSIGGVVAVVLAYAIWPHMAQGSFDLVVVAGFGIAIPVSCAIAILRYGLFEIDVFIKKTVVVGLLAVFITVVYVAVVVGVGQLFKSSSNSGTFLAVVATAVIAVAFLPMRTRARRWADRLVYGDRATPYEVLSRFSERMAGAYAVDDVLPTMARVMGEGTGAVRADVWLCVGTTLRRAASWTPSGEPTGPEPDLQADPGDPSGMPRIAGASIAVPVRQQDELLGALSLVKPSNEPLTSGEDKLVRDLAAQAGLVLRNARLTAELVQRLDELQASRQRIVTAQDQARRRLERNIHDGAQQQLVAMAVKLRLANQLTEKDPERARGLLDDLAAELLQALNDLRDLARGIYPPLLTDQGLVAALDAQARKAPFPVTVSCDEPRRYPQDVEAAVYFCCLEALQNATKYAAPTLVAITLSCSDDVLAFRVVDDGRGFDRATTASGSGLTNMADRVEALGGSLAITSSPGKGTTVAGSIPVSSAAESTPDGDTRDAAPAPTPDVAPPPTIASTPAPTS